MDSRQIGGVVLSEKGGSNKPNELPLDPPLHKHLSSAMEGRYDSQP